MIKKLLISLLIILVVIILFEGIRMFTHPLMKSENMIRNDLLKEIPIGTTMDDVIEFVEVKEEWEINWINYEGGFRHQRIIPNDIIGVKSMQVYFGSYKNPLFLYLFKTNVTVLFGFDENDELIEIWVWKTTDAL